MISSPRFGWHRDLPDPRDFVPGQPALAAMLEPLPRPDGASRPPKIDWREYFPPVEDQGRLASSAAHACVGAVEYFERYTAGRTLDASSLFLYTMTQRLTEGRAEGGACIRSTLKALVRFGLPPKRYWTAEEAATCRVPEPFLYSYARECHPITYVRLDPPGTPGPQVLRTVKSFLAAGFTAAFGFSLFSPEPSGPEIAFPTAGDVLCGGHAVVAVGYNDRHRIRSTRGSLLIRNCWGAGWGDMGYGWLPYAYVERRLAVDFWTLLRKDWLASGELAYPL